MAPTASGVLVGIGIFVIFLQGFNYLVDSYLILYVSSSPLFCSDIICTRTHQQYSAASVFAANTILRSAVGAAFPLFSRQMFQDLGVQWAGTLLGCLSAVMIPIRLAFIFWGPFLQRKSSFAPVPGSFQKPEEA